MGASTTRMLTVLKSMVKLTVKLTIRPSQSTAKWNDMCDAKQERGMVTDSWVCRPDGDRFIYTIWRAQRVCTFDPSFCVELRRRDILAPFSAQCCAVRSQDPSSHAP